MFNGPAPLTFTTCQLSADVASFTYLVNVLLVNVILWHFLIKVKLFSHE